jgi:16S rRNA (guanine966-N2)-methyltransferase
MAMRVTGGDLRGRMVPSPTGNLTRPTSALTRQALFNILGDVDGFCMLDLFAGSGIVGIEALSRGVADLHAVELDKPLAKVLTKTYIDLGVSTKARVYAQDAMAMLKQPFMCKGKIDLLYADPPFIKEYPDLRPFLEWLAPGGVAIFEAPTRTLPVWVGEARDQRRYGESTLLFFSSTC